MAFCVGFRWTIIVYITIRNKYLANVILHHDIHHSVAYIARKYVLDIL